MHAWTCRADLSCFCMLVTMLSPICLLQVNELQLHGTNKHRASAFCTDMLSRPGPDWESRVAPRYVAVQQSLCLKLTPNT